jgi:hypothetical protein
MKITRRKITAVLLAAPAAPAALAQAADPLQTAKDRMRVNSQALAKLDIPMSLEPAFQFKA